MTTLARLRFPFGLLLVLITWKLHYCDESSMQQCLTSIEKLMQDEFNHLRRTEEELDKYCNSVLQEIACLISTDLGKKENSHVVEMTDELFQRITQLCNKNGNRRSVHLKMWSCFEKHQKDFDKCVGGVLAGPSEDQVTKVCREMRSKVCIADTSKKFCGENGEEFGKLLKKDIEKTYDGVCSGATGVFSSYWILLSSALAFILSKNKIPI